jgi:hypothetical protein
MLERDLVTRLRNLVKSKGGVIHKLDPRARKGAPDHVIVLPDRGVFFVELKTDTGKLSPLQQLELDKLQIAGAQTRVLYGLDAVKEFVDA